MLRLWNAPPLRFVREVAGVYFDRRVSRSAAELAYFLILSFFPLLICVNSFVGTLSLDAEAMFTAAAGIIPRESLGILADYISYISENNSPALFLAGLTMTLFSASAAFRALMNIMSDIYERKAYTGIHQIVASVIFSLFFLVTIYLSLVVLLTGDWFWQLLTRSFAWLTTLAGLWQWLRFFLLFFLVELFVLLIYRLSAPRGKPRAPILAGGVLAAGALVAASMLFSLFIGLSSRYALVYGSLASIIILLVWLYLCGNILVLGNVFNYVWYRHKKEKLARRAQEI